MKSGHIAKIFLALLGAKDKVPIAHFVLNYSQAKVLRNYKLNFYNEINFLSIKKLQKLRELESTSRLTNTGDSPLDL